MSSGSNAYWHSRGYKKAPLSTEAKLVDRIKHGDFDVSYYQTLINLEESKYKYTEAAVNLAVRGSDRDREDAIAYHRRQHFKKVQDLKQKMFDDENRKLAELRTLLLEEFGGDWWDELTEKCDGGPIKLYELYKIKSENEKASESI